VREHFGQPLKILMALVGLCFSSLRQRSEPLLDRGRRGKEEFAVRIAIGARERVLIRANC